MVVCLDLHLRGLDPLVNDKNDKAPTGAFFTPQRHRYRWSIFIPAARVCSVPRPSLPQGRATQQQQQSTHPNWVGRPRATRWAWLTG